MATINSITVMNSSRYLAIKLQMKGRYKYVLNQKEKVLSVVFFAKLRW